MTNQICEILQEYLTEQEITYLKGNNPETTVYCIVPLDLIGDDYSRGITVIEIEDDEEFLETFKNSIQLTSQLCLVFITVNMNGSLNILNKFINDRFN